MMHPRQIKAARALLDWSQKDLADAADLSSGTVRNVESGDMSVRGATAEIIRRVFEESGIEFTEGEGVRLRNDTVVVYQGLDSCDMFFDDVLRTIKEKGGEVVSLFKSHTVLIEACGIKLGKFGQMQELSKHTKIKCIAPQAQDASFPNSPCEMRGILKQHIGPSSYFVYGNKYAIVLQEARTRFKFVVFTSESLAEDYRHHFYSMWNLAPPVLDEFNRLKTS
ncbi:MAG: helix-turn-helix transcriptional regulator [Alphaproteobacteria bacterium]